VKGFTARTIEIGGFWQEKFEKLHKRRRFQFDQPTVIKI